MRAIDPMSAVKRADELFHSGWNCAESVFVAIHEQAGEGQAPVQSLTALGGGMGCKRTCGFGALTISIERDFRCLTRPLDEQERDAYPHPG